MGTGNAAAARIATTARMIAAAQSAAAVLGKFTRARAARTRGTGGMSTGAIITGVLDMEAGIASRTLAAATAATAKLFVVNALRTVMLHALAGTCLTATGATG